MDGFDFSKKRLPGATPPKPGAPNDLPAAPEKPVPPAPVAAPRRLTGDLSMFKPAASTGASASATPTEAMPWEPPAPAEGAAPSPPQAPAPPQRPAPQALPTPLAGVGPLRRTTSNLNTGKLLQTNHKPIADALAAQLQNPELISQVAGKGTCVAATVQKTLARQNPELYRQLASELVALGAGRLPMGGELKVSAINRNWIEAQGFSPADKLNALMQAALMELGAPGQGYVLASDSFTAQPAKPPGLSLDQARKLIETLLKTPMLDPRELKTKWDAHFEAAGELAPADPLASTPTPDLVRTLLEGAEAGTFAVVRARDNTGALLRGPDGRPLVDEDDEDKERRKRPPKQNHLVQIIAVDDQAGTVTYIDALGTQRTVEAASFAKILLMSTRSSELEGIGSPNGAAI